MAMGPGVESLDWSVVLLWVRVRCLEKAAEVTVGCIAQCLILILQRLQLTNPKLNSSK